MDKKVYFLKKEIYKFLENDNEFLKKITRPYIKIFKLNNEIFAVPLRSNSNVINKNLQYKVKLTNGRSSYLDFSKSFQIMSESFLECKDDIVEINDVDFKEMNRLLKLTNSLKKQNKLRYGINDYKFLNFQRNLFLKPYLESLGLPTNGRNKFSCLNKHHKDRSPSMSYNQKNNTVHCFSCGETYNFINLIKHTYDLNYKKAANYIDKLIQENFRDSKLNLNVSSNSVYKKLNDKETKYIMSKIEQCSKNIRKTDYLLKRGISYETCEKLKIGYDSKYNQIILPIHHELYFIRRNIDSKQELRYIYMKNRQIPVTLPYSPNGSGDIIFITEGYIDALSLMELNECAMSLNGANNLNNAKEIFSAYKNNNFVIALDNDETGINSTKKLESILKENGSKYRVLSLEEYNDINECLIKDKNFLLSKIKDVKQKFNVSDNIRLEYITNDTLELIYDSEVIFSVSDMGNEMNCVEMSAIDYKKYCDYLEEKENKKIEELEH